MAISQGITGLPFQYGPDGYHQYADCWVNVRNNAVSSKYSAVQLTAPSARFLYVVIFDNVADPGAVGVDFSYLRVSTSDISDWNGTPSTLSLTNRQLGSFDATSTVTHGTTDGLLNSSESNMPTYASVSQTLSYPATPIPVPPGSNFAMGHTTANQLVRVSLRWFERIVPT